jgi:radical SAM protein with 4Fe4S-binding SPASM domain
MKVDIPNHFLYYHSSHNLDLSVLFHPFQSSWLIVNESANDIIKKIAAGYQSEEIADYLTQDYDIELEPALNDIHLIKQILQNKEFDLNKLTLPVQRTPSLKSLFIHITRRCNLHCPHCYVSCTDKQMDLSADTIISLINTLVKEGGDSLTISGGEPLLHPEIKHILSYSSKQLAVRLLTNGSLIDKQMANFLASHGIFVQISLDGSMASIHDAIRGAGSYERAIAAIHLLQSEGAGERLNLCTTLMKRNADDWQDMILFAENKNIPLLRFLHLRKVGRAGNHPDAMPLSASSYEKFIAHVNQMKFNHNQKVELTCGMSGLLLKMPESFKADDIWCPVGRMMVIDANGDVYPCVLMMRDQFLLGNIFSQSLIDISQSRQMDEICQLLTNRRFLIKKCLACSFRNLCQAGCMGQALDHSDSLMETDIFCSYRKKAYEKAFDHLLTL